MNFETIHCPTCGPTDTRQLFVARDIKEFCPGEFSLIQCKKCNLIFLNPRPTINDIGIYYPKYYWDAPPAEEENIYTDAGMRTAINYLVRNYPGGKILDVGCGVGSMLHLLQKKGLDVLGLEPSEHAVQQARERYNLDIQCCFLKDINLPPESLDAITLFDVLEHMHEPVADLQKAYDLLKPGGAVVIKVPNNASWQARLFKQWWYCLDVPRHLFYFSPHSLTAALQKAGFDKINCCAIPDWQGAMFFETSVIYWLRSQHLKMQAAEIQPEEDKTVGEALEGKVYAGVPGSGKKIFRWLLRNIGYLPLATENIFGHSSELLAIAHKK